MIAEVKLFPLINDSKPDNYIILCNHLWCMCCTVRFVFRHVKLFALKENLTDRLRLIVVWSLLYMVFHHASFPLASLQSCGTFIGTLITMEASLISDVVAKLLLPVFLECFVPYVH